MDKEEYASDSDQSDEDFCPTKNADSDAPSEDESGSDFEEEEQTTKSGKSKPVEPETKRVSRHAASSAATSKTIEKDEIESDEDENEKKRADALWADFMGDAEPSKSASTSTSAVKSTHSNSKEEKKPTPRQEEQVAAPARKTVEEIFEFAGEQVKVVKEVEAEPNKLPAKSTGPPKRPGGGLGAVLGQIGKKSKLSVLEKTKMDWSGFKQKEGITEELKTYNQGRDGYLERQDFLQRTDLRQFEIEKSLRQANRKF